MTGITVIVMPAFMAECAPAVLRGLVGSQLQLQIVTAQVVASAVSYATSTNPTDAGWRTAVGEVNHDLAPIALLTSRARNSVCHAEHASYLLPICRRIPTMVILRLCDIDLSIS